MGCDMSGGVGFDMSGGCGVSHEWGVWGLT